MVLGDEAGAGAVRADGARGRRLEVRSAINLDRRDLGRARAHRQGLLSNLLWAIIHDS